MRRHGGARRILSLELLGFKNLLSPASLYSRVNRWHNDSPITVWIPIMLQCLRKDRTEKAPPQTSGSHLHFCLCYLWPWPSLRPITEDNEGVSRVLESLFLILTLSVWELLMKRRHDLETFPCGLGLRSCHVFSLPFFICLTAWLTNCWFQYFMCHNLWPSVWQIFLDYKSHTLGNQVQEPTVCAPLEGVTRLVQENLFLSSKRIQRFVTQPLLFLISNSP